MKKTLYVGLLGLVLAGCTPAGPEMTVEVRGAPEKVAELVAAERSRNSDLEVAHIDGSDTATFAASDATASYEISQRAIKARLSVEARSGA